MLKSVYCSAATNDLFQRYIESRSFTQRTVGEISLAVSAICDYLCVDYLEIDETLSFYYYNYMKDKKLTGNTINSRWSRCKSFSKFIMDIGYPGYSSPFQTKVLEKVPTKINQKKIISLSSIDMLLNAASTDSMAYLLLSLALRIALHTSEIVSIKLSDLVEKEDNMYIFLHNSRFHKENYIKIPNDVAQLLKSHIEHQIYFDSEGHLFYNKWKRPLTLRNLDSIVTKCCSKAGISGYSMRDFRSRAILDMVNATMENGGDVGDVGEYVRIHELRLDSYVSASGLAKSCPAELVHITIKSPESVGA